MTKNNQVEQAEVFERIIEQDGKPRIRVAYPVTFKGRGFLVIQKKHFTDKEGILQWRGGLWLTIADEGDLADIVEAMVEAIYGVLTAGGWDIGQ